MSEQNELPVTWKLGDRWAPFHPQASHVPPDYRDGWNAAFSASTARIAALEAQLEEARKDTRRLDFLESQQDVTWQDHDGQWRGGSGSEVRTEIDSAIKAADGGGK